jgi:uncharacterized protein DUF3489
MMIELFEGNQPMAQLYDDNPDEWLENLIKNPPKGSLEVEVTPDLAKVMLKRNKRNRRLSVVRIRAYATAMAEGRWLLTGEPIIFASDGVLSDGQQRLAACIDCGKSFTTDIRFGVRPEVFKVTNTGKRRSGADILGIAREQHTTQLASALMYLARWEDGTLHRSYDNATVSWGVDPDFLVTVLRKHPGIRDSVRLGKQSYFHFRGFSPAILGFCHYIFSRRDSAAADTFFEQLTTGIGVPNTQSPIHQLRSRMHRYQHDRHEHLGAREQIGLILKVWNAWRASREIPRLQFLAGEMIPLLDKHLENGEIQRPPKERPKRRFSPGAALAKQAMKDAPPKKQAKPKPVTTKPASKPVATNGGGTIAEVERLLRREDGATVVEIAKEMGWTTETVRARLSDIRRMSGKLLIKEHGAKGNVYRLAAKSKSQERRLAATQKKPQKQEPSIGSLGTYGEE